ncbi:flagellar basal body P-ring protein FlgI [Paraferrimonas sp. SM1919]|uniref:flagellar basal body P-ring protein FlgI n=1 Tax=Paraferrimonas sp. SM1919 TaxID=2662263 RepID=UPI0013D25AC2|nr:flagellar basal body P-ring protein FlgI [Paraferrimonas sp. SM1919]
MRVLIFLLSLISLHTFAAPKPLLDVVDVQGVRDNQLIGYGLVVGLSGTGDRTQVRFTSQSIVNMLKQFGVQLSDRTDPKLKNVAAVAVHASIPALAGPGQTIDVTVSSIGDAKSLRGGTLLMTPLKGIDGQVYAVAQGNLVVGGISAQGRDGSSMQINTPTVGTIPAGALIEKEIATEYLTKPQISLNLRQASFTSARNIEKAINQLFGPGVAVAASHARVMVAAPADSSQRVTFMSMLEEVKVETGRKRPKVVFNTRTGTVVMGQDVKVYKAAVSHGNLTVSITERQRVSQPTGFLTDGEPVVTQESNIDIDQQQINMFVWPEGTSLEEIVRAVNSLGASSNDLMAILQALHQAGAMDAELVVI